MALLITDILDFLVAEEIIGGATGWGEFAGYLPPTPDKVIVVFETPGLIPEIVKVGSSEQAYDEPGFQIRGRGDGFDYGPLREKMGEVYRALHDADMDTVTTGDPQYVLIRAVQSGPLPLGLDNASRVGMTWNFEAMRERES